MSLAFSGTEKENYFQQSFRTMTSITILCGEFQTRRKYQLKRNYCGEPSNVVPYVRCILNIPMCHSSSALCRSTIFDPGRFYCSRLVVPFFALCCFRAYESTLISNRKKQKEKDGISRRNKRKNEVDF